MDHHQQQDAARQGGGAASSSSSTEDKKVLQCRLCRSVITGHTLTTTKQSDDSQQQTSCVYRKLADSFSMAAAVEKERHQLQRGSDVVQDEETEEINNSKDTHPALEFAVATAPAQKATRKMRASSKGNQTNDAGNKKSRTFPTNTSGSSPGHSAILIQQPSNAPETIPAISGVSNCPSNMADPNFDPTKWRIKRRQVPTFDERLQALKDFKQQFGHTTPKQAKTKKGESTDDAPHHSLALWVTNVRNNVVKINKEQRAQLNEIGFVWETMKNRRERVWREKFERMQRYKEQFGDCLVPFEWSVDRDLAEWVHTQRVQNSGGTLRADRKHQLEEIGFSWVGRRFVAKQAKKSAALDGDEGDSDQANDYNNDRAQIGDEAYTDRNSGYFHSGYL